MPAPLQTNGVTVDGFPYRVLATDLGGELPIAIFVNNEVARLNAEHQCPANEGYSIAQPRRVHVRYFNAYRAADGGFVFGSRAFPDDSTRLSTDDSQRAIFGLKVSFDENTGAVTSERV